MSDLSKLLQMALYVYRRDPEALRIALDSVQWIDSDDFDNESLAGEITTRDGEKRAEMVSKAVLSAPATNIPAPPEASESLLTWDLIKSRLRSSAKTNEQESGYKVAERSTEEYLVSRYLEHLPQIAARLDFLERGVGDCVPEGLVELFRECNLQFAHANYISVAILMGATLEWSLRDLLNSQGTLGHLLGEAKKQGLLPAQSVYVKQVADIKGLRDKAIHYGQAPPDEVEIVFSELRDVLQFLYRERQENY